MSFTSNDMNTSSTTTRLLTDSFSNSRDCDGECDTSNTSSEDEHESSEFTSLETHFQLKSRRSSSQSQPKNDRLSVCSSPINALKMSSRVCQIKIDEGIGTHLNREIKFERETQNTFKLKSSYDDLNIDSSQNHCQNEIADHHHHQHLQQQQEQLESKFKRYRASSESLNQNIPSPSSPSSFSNASSPRCFSPFTIPPKPSISPSPTRKVYVTRRSMSPIQLQKQMQSTSTKRKLSDLDTDTYGCDTSVIQKKKIHTTAALNATNSSDNIKFVHPLDSYTFQPIKKLSTHSSSNSQHQHDFITPLDSPLSGYQSSIQNNSDSESCTS